MKIFMLSFLIMGSFSMHAFAQDAESSSAKSCCKEGRYDASACAKVPEGGVDPSVDVDGNSTKQEG